MLVEDDPDQRFLIARALSREYDGSIELGSATSLQEACRYIRADDPDCILLDLSLPDARGVAGVETLRTETSAPIVVVTGREDLGVQSLLAGAQDFLHKGDTPPEKLRRSIDGAMARLSALREESRLAAIVRSAPDAMFVRALDGTVLTWNPAAERIFGYAYDEIVGRHYFTLVPERRRDEELARTQRLLSGLQLPAYETVRVHKDGSFIDVSATQAAITSEDRRVVGISHIARDVTAEKDTQRERDLLAGIVDSSLGAIVSFDTEGVFTSWNVGAEQLFGYSASEAIGRPSSFLAPADRREEPSRVLERLLAGEETVNFETVREAKDGRLVDVVVTANPIKGRDGSVIGLAAIYHDVTERKRLETQLVHSQKMEALGGLAGGIAHDFNNLLAVILNYGRFIHEDLPQGHPARADIEEMIGAAQRGATLVRQLLSFARREVVRPEPTNINLLIGQMQPLVERAVAEDIVIETKLAEDLWSTEVDKGQIEQLLLNLVVNARDAMPHGGNVTIETSNVTVDAAFVSVRPTLQEGRYVALMVSDIGEGMDRETQERIFEPFFTTKPRGSGTGLGLASVYGIVQRAGGEISIYSEPGIGTTFKIYLPACDVDAQPRGLDSRTEISLAGKGERILVVEDEPAVVELIARILTKAGYVPLPVSSPQLALEHLRKDPGVQLLLTDVIMPEMSGRTLSEMTLLPTVFMSGYTDSVIAQQGVLQEGVVFLPKPFSADDLLRIVRATLDQDTHIDLTETKTSPS